MNCSHRAKNFFARAGMSLVVLLALAAALFSCAPLEHGHSGHGGRQEQPGHDHHRH